MSHPALFVLACWPLVNRLLEVVQVRRGHIPLVTRIMDIFERISRFRVFCLVFLSGFLWVPVASAAESPPADELYRKAVEKHLQFKDRRAIELLKRLLEKDPGHQKARDLLGEMGVEYRPPAAETRRDEERDTAVRTPEPSPGADTDPPEDLPTEPSTSDAGSDVAGAADPGGDDGPDKRTSRADTSASGSVPELSLLEESDTSARAESESGTPGEPSSDPSSDQPSFRRLGSDSVQNGSAGESGSPSTSPAPTRPPNLNTTGPERLEEVVEPGLASRVRSSIAEQGYYVNWEDLAQRHDMSDQELRNLRNQFRLDVPVLNVNTSSAEELSRLPYLDRSLARNIVDFRFTYGRFTYFEELLDVPGFTESSLSNVRSYLKLR